MRVLRDITPMEEDFSKWYQDVVVKGNLINYGSSKGSMFFKHVSYGIWEIIQKELDSILKKNGTLNVYLPLLIPKSYIEKEKNHVKGFAPELATVTMVGDKALGEPLYIRPTSEVLFGELFKNEISSYKDLPLIFNQWANVVRWEKTTNPFLRNREFLWQEGHTSHSSEIEASNFAFKIIKIYKKFVEEFLAMPVILGLKTEKEKFAGAVKTFTIEAMMKDGKALQSGTSHYLGKNFSKAFDVFYKDKNNNKVNPFQTSWGVSTRLIGGLIMTHGDNRGIIIPPKIAPFQIDIIEILPEKEPKVKEISSNLFFELSDSFRIRKDSSSKSFGKKISQSEIEGTPIRIEIGPKDLKENVVTIVRRDTLQKKKVFLNNVFSFVTKLFNDIQKSLFEKAKKRIKEKLIEIENYDEFKEEIKNGVFLIAPFLGNEKDEEKIKKETGATSRCILMENSTKEKKCFITGKPTKKRVIFARSY